jgi:hypothetical protein
MCILAENYSAAEAYELISQFKAISSNFGAVHSMISIPSETKLPTRTVYNRSPISSTEKCASGTASFQKTYRKVTLGHVPYLVGVMT